MWGGEEGVWCVKERVEEVGDVIFVGKVRGGEEGCSNFQLVRVIAVSKGQGQ